MNKCKTWNHDFSYEGKKKLTEITCKNCDVLLIEWVEEVRDEVEKEAGMDIISLVVNATRNGVDDFCDCGEPYAIVDEGNKYCPCCDVDQGDCNA